MASHISERFATIVNDAQSRVEEITPTQLHEKMEREDDLAVIDVREPEEWNKARIVDAEFMSKGIIERDIEETVPDTESEIVLYCSDGHRSALAADNLMKMGYHNVKFLKGGFHAWTAAGLPIEKEGN
ncbi:MAG: rhodanese-like domain-containing protein [Balneolaceae bacterium]|nr:rhodanese-like domain-containing protein [Balneolaceae bacterium]